MKRISDICLMTFFLSAISFTATMAAQSPQVPLAGSAIPQFAQPLPLLQIGGPVGTGIYTTTGNTTMNIRMCEFWAKVLPTGTIAAGLQPKTRVWGYIVGNSCPAAGPNDPALDTYTGPVIVNQRRSATDGSTDITFTNALGTVNTGTASDTKVLAYKYSVDKTLHWANPFKDMCAHMSMFPAFGSPCAQNYAGPIPAVPHLHGGVVPPEIDGGPDAWYTSDGNFIGNGYYSRDGYSNKNYATYSYPNTQDAAPIWFHDHTLGATRLNVYMGLAGANFIEDKGIIPTTAKATDGNYGTCTTGCLPANLQPLASVVPVVIQDRMFDTNGQLFFPSDSAGNFLWSLNPEHPYWVPEFVGDTILVNGKAWPYLNVQAKRYRFLFLNGSNARTYEMSLINQATGANGPPMWIIGTDGGYLDAPVKLDPALGQKLVMQPGERYEVIIDFTGFANSRLIVRNTGRTPYPKGAPPQGSTLGRIMQFRVGAVVADTSYNPASGTPLRSGSNAIKRLTTAGALPAGVAKTRSLTLNEVMGMPQTVIDPVTGLLTAYPGGPLEILVNNTKWSGDRINGTSGGMFTFEHRADFTPVTLNGVTNYISELPREGDTEVWEIVNLTADAHPIHLHLTQFQIINRQNFNVSNYTKTYAAAFPGGGFDPMTGTAYAPAFFIPGFGPPLNYNPSVASGNKYGGNPDVTPFLQGPILLPLAQELGWKDTIITYPGQVTRLAVRWAPMELPTNAAAGQKYYPFDPSGLSGSSDHYGYVWHCHIVDHEDNEMMRPDVITLNPSAPAPASRPLVKGVNY
jgi:FtsP/CotA-like multicopper oxidase with cupredoxin domain